MKETKQKPEIEEFRKFIEVLMLAYNNYRSKPLTKKEQVMLLDDSCKRLLK